MTTRETKDFVPNHWKKAQIRAEHSMQLSNANTGRVEGLEVGTENRTTKRRYRTYRAVFQIWIRKILGLRDPDL